MPTMLVSTKKTDPSIKTILRDFEYMIDSVVEDKFDIRKDAGVLATYMDINECDNCIYFEYTSRNQRLWVTDSDVTLKFKIVQYMSIYDLSFPVNYHKYAGHVLIFSKEFDDDENLGSIQKIFKKAFRPKEDAPVERVIGFFVYDDMICIRNYLINGVEEIGPRINIVIEKAFQGCFKGPKISMGSVSNGDSEN